MAAGSAVAATGDELDALAEGDVIEALPRRKWSGKRMVLVGGIPLLLILIGAGLYVSGIFGGHGDAKTEEAAAEAPKAPQGPAIYVDIPEILVNLESSGKQRFLKTSISLEVSDDQSAETVKKVMPRLVDQFQTYLRGLRVEDLHGSGGVYRLRQELLARVAKAAEPATVNDVLFRELLVQ